MPVEPIVSALVWTLVATTISLLVTVGLLRVLGVRPSALAHEIVEIQNPAVGAAFFIIALTAALFVSPMASAGFTADVSAGRTALWVLTGLVMASGYAAAAVAVAHRVLRPRRGERLHGYIRRELIEEQNVSLTFFLGGLVAIPFVAVVFQLI